jgi:hypothetical protein
MEIVLAADWRRADMRLRWSSVLIYIEEMERRTLRFYNATRRYLAGWELQAERLDRPKHDVVDCCACLGKVCQPRILLCVSYLFSELKLSNITVTKQPEDLQMASTMPICVQSLDLSSFY